VKPGSRAPAKPATSVQTDCGTERRTGNDGDQGRAATLAGPRQVRRDERHQPGCGSAGRSRQR